MGHFLIFIKVFLVSQFLDLFHFLFDPRNFQSHFAFYSFSLISCIQFVTLLFFFNSAIICVIYYFVSASAFRSLCLVHSIFPLPLCSSKIYFPLVFCFNNSSFILSEFFLIVYCPHLLSTVYSVSFLNNVLISWINANNKEFVSLSTKKK
jgi:hypothetical protein